MIWLEVKLPKLNAVCMTTRADGSSFILITSDSNAE